MRDFFYNGGTGFAADTVEKKILTTPFSEEEIRSLKSGDIIYITGTMVTARDDAHKRLVKNGVFPRVSLDGAALYHAGPIVSSKETGGYDMVSCGPTTSMRMEKFEADFIKMSGIRLIIGKGGMGEVTENACREQGAVHCVFPGGCAVVAAKCVEEISGVEWEDLGMPEAMWVLKVKEFGPLIVNIDTQGGNMIAGNKRQFDEKKREQLLYLTDSLKKIH